MIKVKGRVRTRTRSPGVRILNRRRACPSLPSCLIWKEVMPLVFVTNLVFSPCRRQWRLCRDAQLILLPVPPVLPPQWGAADAEIKVPSGENTELKRSPFKAWSRSVYSHTCYAHCQGFLPCLFLFFQSIHLHFFQNLSWFLLCWLWLTHGSCVCPQNKIGHPAGCRFPCWVPAEYK